MKGALTVVLATIQIVAQVETSLFIRSGNVQVKK